MRGLRRFVIAVALSAVAPLWASAGPEVVIEEPLFVVPQPEARGCYFERGRRFCGRYCYVEVNGKRYCQERERRAYPQGYFEYVPVDPGATLK